MRTKRFIAFLMMCCLAFSLAACGNQTNASQELDGIFPAIAGENGTTYQSLFDVILDEQYDAYWNEKCASIVGDEAAEVSAQALKSSVSRDIYGQEAIDTYAQSGDMGFDCWYINNAKTFESLALLACFGWQSLFLAHSSGRVAGSSPTAWLKNSVQ